ILVFSKTSFQLSYISPSTPRALYFNDRSYIGWEQEAPVLEVATVDPRLGAVFYLLSQKPAPKPQFIRKNDECLECHNGTLTQDVPGFTMRSVFPAADGQPLLQAGTFVTTDASPLSERWGGWYVSGLHGSQRHMGNVTASSSAPDQLNREEGANVTDLSTLFDVTPYLAPSSDIVALMVAEHQTHVENLITRANYQTRMALRDEQELNKDLGRPSDYLSDSTVHRIKNAAESLVEGLLFADEAPLSAPVSGTSGFATAFAAEGPFDHQRRSLRQFDLKRRLFRYPCSFLIYSEAFDGLPAMAADEVYRRLNEVLSGRDKTAPFSHLSAADRQAILEILLDTKPAFAAWRAKSGGQDTTAATASETTAGRAASPAASAVTHAPPVDTGKPGGVE
ncbi:MAG: hypothetical protein LC772_12935, partial [Chloroflexi bacterium]|nr:hypothetical protein [Chloroflexota bacterium]